MNLKELSERARQIATIQRLMGKTPTPKAPETEVTTVWRDGEVWRTAGGKTKRLKDIESINDDN